MNRHGKVTGSFWHISFGLTDVSGATRLLMQESSMFFTNSNIFYVFVVLASTQFICRPNPYTFTFDYKISYLRVNRLFSMMMGEASLGVRCELWNGGIGDDTWLDPGFASENRINLFS